MREDFFSYVHFKTDFLSLEKIHEDSKVIENPKRKAKVVSKNKEMLLKIRRYWSELGIFHYIFDMESLKFFSPF